MDYAFLIFGAFGDQRNIFFTLSSREIQYQFHELIGFRKIACIFNDFSL